MIYLFRLGELQALVGKLFAFARNLEDFDSRPLIFEEFSNAYRNLNIDSEDIHIDERMNLEEFTNRAITRGENT